MSQAHGAVCSPESVTRKSASRYSLNAFGRALADVMNKDTNIKDSSRERAAKKPRDSSAHSIRRVNAMSSNMNSTNDRRSSIGERPPAQEDTFSPSETITRTSRRRSALLKDAVSPVVPVKASSPAVPTRRSTLRPRPTGNGSALPKFRPRSALIGSHKDPPSPPHLGTRKRATSSDEEKVEAKGIHVKLDSGTTALHEKTARPISPLPQRALPTSRSAKLSPSPPAKSSPRTLPSPTRNITPPPNKMDRTSKLGTPSRSTIPRPPSSTSSSSSLPTPRTPTRQTTRNHGTSAKGGTSSCTPARKQPESPSGKKTKQDGIPKIVKVDQFNRSHSESSTSSAFTEGDSIDDIEFMLGSVVSPTAPTPALPRLQDRHQHGNIPQTPSRASNLPTRANLSYLSPMPPPIGAPPSLKLMRAGHDRGSLLSWDQLVAVGDRTLGEGEIDKMIADVPAPFSPAPSTVDLELTIPESPSLSTLPSPAGYGSISQVLLPDVTPSPASTKHMQFSEHSRPATADASLVVMLRLQLASMENIAKERLTRITALEAQLDCAADLAAQVTALEEQMHVSFENRDRAAEERATLEEQLRGADVAKELAVQDAVRKTAEDGVRLKVAAEEAVRRKCEVNAAARTAATSWVSVHELALSELEFVRAQRETVAFLLASLDQYHII
ncbi:hypothetical protein F5148DRAFT_1168743 [Russula earlei]|uniref:Uncharacterized protein n=1 Tax=Russula earlei TaxID=71964 RepID=A0ACC0UJN4_9AGAM|nr:hypothetical protein F5148DRAFT_1168743 [Russula earlei]